MLLNIRRMPSPQTFQLRIMRETLETLVSRAIGTKSSPEKLMPPSIICSPTINSGTLPFPTANQDRNRGRWNTNHYSNLCPICKHHTTPKRAINIIESHFPSRSDSPIERKKYKNKIKKHIHTQTKIWSPTLYIENRSTQAPWEEDLGKEGLQSKCRP